MPPCCRCASRRRSKRVAHGRVNPQHDRVPLWKGDEILGVLQVDNRDAPAMLNQDDVEVLTVLAANASLAIAGARLIQRLSTAEERLNKENAFLKSREEKRQSAAHPILGQSQSMMTLLAQLDKVAETRVTVLIEGETGTGKELIASALHYRSKRRDKLFVTQNCAAVPENLLESELFGHKRGAFTGANDEKKGLFEIADGGTLFLDEVTEMPLSLQSKPCACCRREVRQSATRETSTCASSQLRTATSRSGWGRFREISITGSRSFRCASLRCASAATTSPFSPTRSSSATRASSAGPPTASPSRRSSFDGLRLAGQRARATERSSAGIIDVEEGAFVTKELLSLRIRQVEGSSTGRAPPRNLREMMDSVEKYLLIEALREHNHNKTSAPRRSASPARGCTRSSGNSGSAKGRSNRLNCGASSGRPPSLGGRNV